MPEGKVTFRSENPDMSFTCWLGNDGAKPTGGYGGWEIVDRPRRLALTQWNGRQPIQMDVDLLFDGWRKNDSIELECQILEKMAFSDDFDGPPIVHISGPVPHTGLEYRILNITWGDFIRRNSDGDRVRQAATVTIVRDNRPDKLQLSAAKAHRNRKKKRDKITGHGA